MDVFAKVELLTSPYDIPRVMMWPYAVSLLPFLTEHRQIPTGELAVRRGYTVRALDGAVGRMDEFLVDPETWHVTHLVMREGHLWGQRDVTIPVSQIARIDEGIVYLKLDKRSVEALPAVPVRRRERC